MGETPTRLGDIVEALREVETTLERRARRAEAAVLMIWGLVGLLVFGPLQLVEWAPGPIADALRPTLPWLWIVPVALGRVGTALVEVRGGRMAARSARSRWLRNATALLAVACVVALIVAGAARYVPALALAFIAARLLLLAAGDARLRPWADGLAVVSLAAGLALALRPQPWGHLVVVALFGGGFLALGLLKWHAPAR